MKRAGGQRGLGGIAAAACAVALFVAPTAWAGGTGVTLSEVGDGFDSPVLALGAPDVPDVVYVVEKSGVVRAVENGEEAQKPFLDIRDLVSDQGEQGLLSIAFPENYADTGLFYAYYTNRKCKSGACDIEIAEFKRRGDNNLRALSNTHRRVISIRHRDASNHNGGTAAFGPDGKLWIATGDGGGGNDQYDNASRKNKLLGKLLRIDPRKPNRGKGRYRVPKDNPFVDAPGKDEIWSIGLRNPFRFSFDGDVIAIGDVGQGSWEEVNIVPIDDARGADFGWPAREGQQEGPRPDRQGSGPLLDPIHDYPQVADPPDDPFGGQSVNGGVVVRDPRLAGTAFDPATGRYIFGETFEDPNVRSLVPDVEAQTFTGLTGHDELDVGTPVGFGEDALQQVYIASLGGGVYRLDPLLP